MVIKLSETRYIESFDIIVLIIAIRRSHILIFSSSIAHANVSCTVLYNSLHKFDFNTLKTYFTRNVDREFLILKDLVLAMAWCKLISMNWHSQSLEGHFWPQTKLRKYWKHWILLREHGCMKCVILPWRKYVLGKFLYHATISWWQGNMSVIHLQQNLRSVFMRTVTSLNLWGSANCLKILVVSFVILGWLIGKLYVQPFSCNTLNFLCI